MRLTIANKPMKTIRFQPADKQAREAPAAVLSTVAPFKVNDPAEVHLPPSPLHLPPPTFHHPPSRRSTTRRAGFTLMEINLALLIMAVGLIGSLSLFHVGIRQKSYASSDTVQAAFADLVFNAMRANAQMVTNWDGADGWVALDNGACLGVGTNSPDYCRITVPTVLDPNVPILCGGAVQKIGPTLGDGYLVKGQYLEYTLHLKADDNNNMLINAYLQISTRRYTDLSRSPIYATTFVYMGM